MANTIHLAYKQPVSLGDLTNMLKDIASKLSLSFFDRRFEDIYIFKYSDRDEWLTFYSVAYSNFGESLPSPYTQYGTLLEIAYENYQMLIVPVLKEIFKYLPDAIVADLEDNINRDAHIATATDLKDFKGDNPWFILNRTPDV